MPERIQPGADAGEIVRADLRRIRAHRRSALVGCTILLGLLAAYGFTAPNGPMAWAATVVFTCAGLLAAALSLGVPSVAARSVVRGSALAFIAILVGLVLSTQAPDAEHEFWADGLTCLWHGASYSIYALIAFAIATGRLWRRFGPLTWATALAAASTGLGVLSAACVISDPVHLFGFHLPALAAAFLIARGLLSLRKHVD